jgi:hypothetical protein
MCISSITLLFQIFYVFLSSKIVKHILQNILCSLEIFKYLILYNTIIIKIKNLE